MFIYEIKCSCLRAEAGCLRAQFCFFNLFVFCKFWQSGTKNHSDTSKSVHTAGCASWPKEMWFCTRQCRICLLLVCAFVFVCVCLYKGGDVVQPRSAPYPARYFRPLLDAQWVQYGGSSRRLCFLLLPDDSADWLLRCHCSSPPPHCCCDIILFIFILYFFLVWVGFCLSAPLPMSTSPGFLGSHSSSPLCSGMASGINQSNHPLFCFLFLSFSLGGEDRWGEAGVTSQLTGVVGVVCLSQVKHFFLPVCLKQQRLGGVGSGYYYPRPLMSSWMTVID